MENINKFLEMIKQEEGGYLHRNKSEADITTGYGIYRYANPSAPVFMYIDEIAKNLNITTLSHEWNNDEIKLVNDNLDKEQELLYTKEFYQSYFKVDLNQIPYQLSLAYASIFINTNKIANISLQKSYNYMVKTYSIGLDHIDEDGIIGSKSKSSIYQLNKSIEDKLLQNIWFIVFLNQVQYEYVQIATDNGKEDAQLPYLRGWINRTMHLLKNISNI